MNSKHIDIIARALQRMCEGEIIQYHQRFCFDISKLQYFRVITKKTAILFKMSCSLGANVSRCNQKVLKKLIRFAFNYGIAFQIADDLRDLSSNSDKEGKTVLSDLRAGTMTLPVIFAREESLKVKKLLDNIPDNFSTFTMDDWTSIRDEILKTNAILKTKTVIEKLRKRATDILDKLPKNENKYIFIQMMNYLDNKN
jgi:heptaprenyl diphosphate synthase